MKYLDLRTFEKINQAENYSQLVPIALSILERMPNPIAQVCGPISTGGVGSIKCNLSILEKTISKVNSGKYTVFDQTGFEKPIQKMRQKQMESLSKEETNIILLEEFYGKVLESKKIETLFFIYGWESSKGSIWENKKAKKLGLERVYLPKYFLKKNIKV